MMQSPCGYYKIYSHRVQASSIPSELRLNGIMIKKYNLALICIHDMTYEIWVLYMNMMRWE